MFSPKSTDKMSDFFLEICLDHQITECHRIQDETFWFILSNSTFLNRDKVNPHHGKPIILIHHDKIVEDCSVKLLKENLRFKGE